MPTANHNNGTIDIANVGYPLAKTKGSAAATCSTASCHVNVYGAGTVTTPVWGTSASCNACHTVAIDATGPNTGSHAKHNDTTCTDCHAAGTTQITKPTTGHLDGTVTVTNGYPVTAKHAAGSYSGTCSTAACHADPYSAGLVTTPIWGTTAGCAACHTGAGTITANGPATGSHTNVTSHAVVCTTCHEAGTSATTKPSTGHADGNIDTANVGYPLNKVKGSAAATCSTASCHADPYSAGLVTTPVWGTTGNGCAACHTGTKVITATGPATGSHTNVTSHAVVCTTCHAAGTTATSSPTSGHANGTIDIANVGYPLAKAKGSAAATCSTASCHADPYSAATVVTPVWGTTGNGCAACHTGTKVITANGPATGSHINTASHAVACTTCHAAGTSATTKPGTGHADGNIDVANVGYPAIKGKGSAATTCSTASCHADPYSAGLVTTPVWGTTGNGCAACHTGVKAITANGPATGSHTNVTSHAVACTTCHAAGTSATSAPSTGHANGTIDIANVGYPLAKVKGSAAATCSTASCHADPYSAGLVTTPVWGTTGNGCAACHTGTKVITANGPVTGSHTNVTSHAVACTTCHGAGTTATSSPTSGHADGNIDVANVGYPLDKVKGSAATTCSTASCHADPYSAATVVTPVWGTTGNGCAACHTGTKAITATGPATGSHTTVTAHAVACTTCHAAGTTATSAPSTGHANGTIDIGLGYPTSKTKGTAGASCSTSVCHGSTSPAWGTTTTNDTCTKCHGTGTAAGTITAANEYVVAPSDLAATDTGKVSSLAKVGAHQTHLQLFNGLSQQGADAKARCEVCHTLPTVGTHANGSAAPTFTGIAAGGTYNAGSCSVYCHNPAGTVLAAGNAGTGTTPLWTNASYIDNGPLKSDTNCNTCHKSPGTAGFTAAVDHGAVAMPLGIGTDCAGCHGHNGGIGGNAGQQHMDGIKFGNGSCDACHGYPPLTSAQMTARTAGQYVNAKVEDYAGGAGHHSTHLLASVKSSEGFTPCLPCHPSAFHNGGNGTVAKANINVNDAADPTFRFDESRSKRYTVATQSCSNVSCHYQPTPAWAL
jgi:predicted CxxxxCH...CXXCH cytochrome family protein